MNEKKSPIKIETLMLELGWSVILLPWISVICTLMFPSSISTTFYTNAGWLFAGIMTISAFCLFNYVGYGESNWKHLKRAIRFKKSLNINWDDLLTDIAAVAILLIVWCPCIVDTTTNHICVNDLDGRIGTFLLQSNVSNVIHFSSAILLFGVLSFISIFLFRKNKGQMTRNKKIRNIIYLVCGIGMLASFAIMLLPDFYIKTWLVECIALTLFGISWLTKAGQYKWLFCD